MPSATSIALIALKDPKNTVVTPNPKLKNKIIKAKAIKLFALQKEFFIKDITQLEFPQQIPKL
ncbi:MAG TPA: hypothetical protein VIK78_00700 [Ruminiclostridium sp.]